MAARVARARTALVALAAAATLALASCQSNSGQVRWSTYLPTLQTRIDAASVVRNCPALAGFRRIAEATSEAHEKATGFPNDALVTYIEAAQRRAGC
jgi:hypothetical protein